MEKEKQQLDFDNLFLRYKNLREATNPLNDKLVERMDPDLFSQAARRLGVLDKDGKTLILETEHELAVVADFNIHCMLRQGRNLIEHCLDRPEGFDEQERAILQRLADSRYAVAVALDMEPGVGFFARDLITNREFFLAESFFSQTAVPGAVMAARLLSVDEFRMTTGAGLPVMGRDALAQISKIINEYHHSAPELLRGVVQRKVDAALNERIARYLLKKGMSSRIAVGGFGEDPEELLARARERGLGDYEEEPGTRSRRKIGPNEPCPCGSGKKYKKCCGGFR